MGDLTIRREEIGTFIEGILNEFEVLAPVRKDGKFVFEEIRDRIDDIVLDYDTTILPPKKVFYPQHEIIYRYKIGEKGFTKFTHEEDETKRLLLGVHPCDIIALVFLDKVFSREYKDPYYLPRRNNTLIIGMTCNSSSDHCFCSTMDAGPDISAGYDLLLTDLGDRYYVRVKSREGRELVSKNSGVFLDATEKDSILRREKLNEVERSLGEKLNLGGIPTKMEKLFNDGLWDEIADECLCCGGCNVSCPTCHCFDIVDRVDITGTRGYRERIWDACHLIDFARIAGHNFRESRTSRFKQRIYDKLCYSYEKFGRPACVGCGRCLLTCPAEIDIRNVIDRINAMGAV